MTALGGQGLQRSCEPDHAQFARPSHRAGVELYRAHIVHQRFDPHSHQAFGLGAIESGVERFRYRGSDHLAPDDSVVLMNPDELHTGQAETDAGWCYRMVYIDEAVLFNLSGEAHWWFPEAVSADARRARSVSRLLAELWDATTEPRDPLRFDCALLLLVEELRPLARVPRPMQKTAAADFKNVIDYMHSHLDRSLCLEELARCANLSPFHFLRMFKTRHHVTPQQMLMALRLLAAKERLAQGDAVADVAASVGLTDQPHLTRCFAKRYGVTPARYQRQVRG